MSLPRLLTPAEVAQVLRCSPANVRRLCRDGELAAARVGAAGRRPQYVIPEDEVRALLQARGLSSYVLRVGDQDAPELGSYTAKDLRK